MEQNDTERLKQKLALLGEPALPASLSAEALFRRMDEGRLTLPDREPEPEEETRKVIPWAKVMKRGLPVAACFALVVALYQGQRGLNGAPAPADYTPAPAAAPENAAQSFAHSDGETPSEEAGANSGLVTFRMIPEAQEDAQPDLVPEDTQQKIASSAPSQASDGSEAAPVPDDGWRTGPEYSLPTREAESQMRQMAQNYAPGPGFTPHCFSRLWSPEDDWVEFEVKYRDEEGEVKAAARFTCEAEWPQDSEAPRLSMVSYDEIDPDELF